MMNSTTNLTLYCKDSPDDLRNPRIRHQSVQKTGHILSTLQPLPSFAPSDLYLAILHNDAIKFATKYSNLNTSRLESTTTKHLHNGYTVLGFAIKKGCTAIVKYLIQNNADINAANKKTTEKYPETPIHTALRYERYEILEMLLCQPELDVNSNYDDPYFTPLDHAVKSLSIQLNIIQAIISHPRFQFNASKPLLFRSCIYQNVSKHQIIIWLLNCGFKLLYSGQTYKCSNSWILSVSLRTQLEHSLGYRLLVADPNDDDQSPTVSPLTLKQLSRCAIRSRLLQVTGKIIEKDRLAKQIPLPNEICNYLWDLTLH